MTAEKITLGKAIDQIVEALSTLDKKEQQTVISTVCSLFELNTVGFANHTHNPPAAITPSQAQTPHAGAQPAKQDDREHKHGLDIRALKDQKQPDSARQMACIVAYYLLDHAPEAERKRTITPADIEKYFKQAHYKLPKRIEQLLVDGKASGYFETVTRGEYKLTRVGYNLVTHSMPKGTKE